MSGADVYLYELALELGEKSLDLAERARGLGVADAGPSTLLTTAQAAAIRAGVRVPPKGVLSQPVLWAPPPTPGSPPPPPPPPSRSSSKRQWLARRPGRS